MSSSTFKSLTDGSFFFFQVPCSWPFSYSNLFTIFGKWSKWTGFIHTISLWWQPLYFTMYSLPLKHVCLTRNMLLISMVSICSMASTSSHIFCFWSSFYSSHKNNLNFETWKVRYATKLAGKFKMYMSGCGLCKIS